MRTSMPIFEPPMSSELPMLKRPSPRKQYEMSWSGLSLNSCIVRKSARIWVGWNSSVRPFQTGTPALSASSSTISWPKPRYSIPS